MKQTLFFVHDDRTAAEELAAPHRDGGWQISFASPYDEDALNRIAETNPIAAVFCLDGDCFESTSQLAREVMADPRRVRPLMVFVGGSEESVMRAKAEIPVGLFV